MPAPVLLTFVALTSANPLWLLTGEGRRTFARRRPEGDALDLADPVQVELTAPATRSPDAGRGSSTCTSGRRPAAASRPRRPWRRGTGAASIASIGSAALVGDEAPRRDAGLGRQQRHPVLAVEILAHLAHSPSDRVRQEFRHRRGPEVDSIGHDVRSVIDGLGLIPETRDIFARGTFPFGNTAHWPCRAAAIRGGAGRPRQARRRRAGTASVEQKRREDRKRPARRPRLGGGANPSREGSRRL